MAADKKTYMRWGIIAGVIGGPALFITILHLSWGNEFSLLYLSLCTPLLLGCIYIFQAYNNMFNKLSNISLIFCRLAFYTGIVTLLLVPFVFTRFIINYEEAGVVAVIFLLTSFILAVISLFIPKRISV